MRRISKKQRQHKTSMPDERVKILEREKKLDFLKYKRNITPETRV